MRKLISRLFYSVITAGKKELLKKLVFASVLTFLYFYTITNFYSHSYHYCYDYFCYYGFCHCHCHYYFFIFNAFNFYFSSFYHSILSLYISNILNFKQMTWPKHSKLALKVLRLHQCNVYLSNIWRK